MAVRRRKPKGYTGHQHETIGSDILSILQILKLPDQVLGKVDADRIRAVEPKAWYPIEWMLDLTPHHCIMEQGLLSVAFAAVNCPGLVSQRDCFRLGADACIYTITSSFTDERWFGKAKD